jgi:hypothetical protein
VRMTVLPIWASARAVANPRPRLAPVTSAIDICFRSASHSESRRDLATWRPQMRDALHQEEAHGYDFVRWGSKLFGQPLISIHIETLVRSGSSRCRGGVAASDPVAVIALVAWWSLSVEVRITHRSGSDAVKRSLQLGCRPLRPFHAATDFDAQTGQVVGQQPCRIEDDPFAGAARTTHPSWSSGRNRIWGSLVPMNARGAHKGSDRCSRNEF